MTKSVSMHSTMVIPYRMLRASWTERKTKRVVDKIWSGLVLRRRPNCGEGDPCGGSGSGREGVD